MSRFGLQANGQVNNSQQNSKGDQTSFKVFENMGSRPTSNLPTIQNISSSNVK